MGLAKASDENIVANASALVRAGKIHEAENLLRSASFAEPQSARLHGELGALLLREGYYEGAVEELGLAVQIDSTLNRYVLLLSESLIGWGHFGVAVDFLRAAEARVGRYPAYHYNLGLAYYNLNKKKDAESEFEKALHLAPHMYSSEFLLATCLADEGNLHKALQLYRRLVKEQPKNATYWIGLAQALGQMGSEYGPEALKACRHGLTLQPENLHGQFVTATILSQIGEFGAARPLLEHLEQLDPSAVYVHSALARVYKRLGEAELARQQASLAIELQEQERNRNGSNPQNSQSLPQSH